MVTTIKIQEETKARLDKLKEHKRETYDDLLRKMLGILNVAKVNPDRSKSILESIDRHKKVMNMKKQGKNNAKPNVVGEE